MQRGAAAGGVARRPHRTRWKVSQYISRGCAAATAIVRYMRSWFRAPRTGTPSAAASARIFSRRVRIWGGEGLPLSPQPGGAPGHFWSLPRCSLHFLPPFTGAAGLKSLFWTPRLPPDLTDGDAPPPDLVRKVRVQTQVSPEGAGELHSDYPA